MPETGSRILLLQRLTLCLCFNAPFADAPAQIRSMGRLVLVCARASIANCKRDRGDECCPHFSFPVLLRLGRSLDGKRVR